MILQHLADFRKNVGDFVNVIVAQTHAFINAAVGHALRIFNNIVRKKRVGNI